jgi:hypothetical protein
MSSSIAFIRYNGCPYNDYATILVVIFAKCVKTIDEHMTTNQNYCGMTFGE